jgi:hypothetical protein
MQLETKIETKIETQTRLETRIENVTKVVNHETNSNALISISPGGFFGFYLFGICTYIKEHYDLTDILFTGASAGAWNALFMTYKKDPLDLAIRLMDKDKKSSVDKSSDKKTISALESRMKEAILESSTMDDFDLEKLHIGVVTMKHCFLPQTTIFTNFTNLEDAIDCCISSSHIPFVTGGLFNKYRNVLAFDGGFSSYPYLVNNKPPILHITPSMWYPTEPRVFGIFDVIRYAYRYKKGELDLYELFEKGYDDTRKNRAFLDGVLMKKKEQ